MASNESHRPDGDHATRALIFITTHRSIVLTATGADTTQAQAALERL